MSHSLFKVMAPILRLLHITDLHITDPTGDTEYLREGYYDEYLNGLVRKVVRPVLNGERVDCVMITGDFVDKGQTAYFDHASKVISHLATQLDLESNRIAICNGNHDIVRAYENAGDGRAAREAFKRFSSQFANATPAEESDRAVLLNPVPKLWCLMIDATLGSSSPDSAGNLTTAETDSMMKWIKGVPRSELLVIGTHYPVHTIMAQEPPFAEQDPDWFKRHMWYGGEALRKRISDEAENRPKTLWLNGDIHLHFNIVQDGIRFISTGRLGTPTARMDSQMRREARVIQIPLDQSDPSVSLFEFTPRGHYADPNTGSWRQISEEEVTALTIEKSSTATKLLQSSTAVITVGDARNETVAESVAVESNVETDIDIAETTPAVEPSLTVGLELISDPLQEALLSTIREARLYHFGRFDTSDTEVSLAWVSMGLVLNQGGILASIIDNMAGWLKTKMMEVGTTPQEGLLIGIDCWGSVMASQLSVLTGVPNICVAERGGGQHHLPSETLSSDCFSAIRNAKTIVFVNDVVATGSSLVRLNAKIKRGVPEASEMRWLCLSILCDEQQKRSADTSFLDSHGTCCKDLRMPIVRANQLPEHNILPPLISFI